MVARTFHWADYLVFALMLGISAGIGVYYFIKDRRKTSTKEFLLGGGNMAAFPVAMSLKASFLSAVSVLGIPTEIYFYGTMYTYYLVAMVLANPVTAHVFIPIYRRLQLTSGYEYLELRYSRVIRSMGSIVFILLTVLYMAIALYAPAIAFSQVTGLSLWVTLIGTGVVCTLYTSMGGMKAVIWTDTFQMLVITAGLIAMLVKGSIEVGGMGAAWEKASKGQRIVFDNFNPDPTVRISFWTQAIGGTAVILSVMAANQTMIQRYLSTKTTRGAQTAVYVSLFGGLLLSSLLILIGIVMYAYYGDCDPLKNGQIEKPDQMVPLLMMDILGDYYGLPGLFTACTFSAALSTVSSGVNALAAVTLEDIIKPLYELRTHRTLTDARMSFISKILAVVFGLGTIALGYCAQFFGKIIIQIAYSIMGMAGGPLLAVFLQGMLFPCTNKWGVGSGLVVSLLLNFWVGIGSILSPGPKPLLPTTLFGCPNETASFNTSSASMMWSSPEPFTTFGYSPEDEGNQSLVQNFYNMSFMWYGVLAVVTSLLVGLPVSYFTGWNRGGGDLSDLVITGCMRCVPSADESDTKKYTFNQTNGLSPEKKQADDGEYKMKDKTDLELPNAHDNPAFEVQRF